jgi:crotonobetainyl-CoA:carnitine CoA-transferase CaiB-like acyl-CoA transferase
MRPLSDVRIIAVEQYGAGPFGSLQLADLGADIVKVEDPRTDGDVGRTVPPFAEGEDSLFFEAFNRGKRSISLDLTNSAGRAVFEDLVRGADAVFSNLRGDATTRLRLRYADLAAVNPRIVCCALTAYPADGPRANDPGYDYLVQGLAGWMSITGEPDAPPTKTGPSVVDYAAGLNAALALVAAIHGARRDGVGRDCEVTMFDTAVGMLGYLATWHLTAGYEPGRTVHSAHPSLVPFQNFATADGWIVVACAKQKFWLHLVDAIDRPDLAADERYADFDGRRRHAAELLDQLRPAFASRPTDEWLAILPAAGVPCAPVNTVAQGLIEHRASGGVQIETAHTRFGTVRHAGPMIRVVPPPAEYLPAPTRGQHTGALLAELGYDADAITMLQRSGAFGDTIEPPSTATSTTTSTAKRGAS